MLKLKNVLIIGLLIMFVFSGIAGCKGAGNTTNMPGSTPIPGSSFADVVVPSKTLSKIVFRPEAGQYLYYDSQSSTGIILKSISIKSGYCEEEYLDYSKEGIRTVHPGDPCLLLWMRLESQLEKDYWVSLTPIGLNSNGQTVSGALEYGPVPGVGVAYLPAKETCDYILHLTIASDITTLNLIGRISTVVPP